jgi:hypothetical protein
MTYEFRWNDWNAGHIGEHGVSSDEAEQVIEHPGRGYPEKIGGGKYRVRGQSAEGRFFAGDSCF